MTDACPPNGELLRLLAGVMTTAQEQVLNAHVAACSACQRRLAQLQSAAVTLPINEVADPQPSAATISGRGAG